MRIWINEMYFQHFLDRLVASYDLEKEREKFRDGSVLLASNIIFRFTDFLKYLSSLSFFTIFLYLSFSSHCLSLSIFLPSLSFAALPPLSVSLPRLVTRKRSAREYVITLYGASIYARVSLSSSRHRQFKIKREHLPRASLRRLRRDRPYIPKPRNVEGVRGFASRSPLWRTFFFYSFFLPLPPPLYLPYLLATLILRSNGRASRGRRNFLLRLALATTKKEISKDPTCCVHA